MKKVLITFGTRPEAIKMAPVVEPLAADGACYEKVPQAHNPYGDGLAGGRIAEVLRRV